MSVTQPDAEIWVRDFTPGFQDSPEDDTLPKGATPDARNGFFYNVQVEGQRRAVLGRRQGSRLINPTRLGAVLSQAGASPGYGYHILRIDAGTQTDRLGQQIDVATDVTVSRVTVPLNRLGAAPAGSIWITLQTGDIGPAGVVLATSALVDAATVPANEPSGVFSSEYTDITFVLPTTAVPAGTVYLVLHGDYPRSGVDYIVWSAGPAGGGFRYDGAAIVPLAPDGFQYALASGPPQRVDLFEWRRGGAAAELLAMSGGELSSVDPLTGVTTAIGSGWTPGRSARMLAFRNDAFVFDGTVQQRWDGVTLYPVGSAEPTVLTNMAAGAGTLTGSFEAVYTWYNANRDHYSSPSAPTAVLALAAQGRLHTRPGSAIPTWATHWVAFVRRTDTSELNFYFTVAVPIATATQLETVSTVVRQRGVLAPLPSAHDAPPGAWLVLDEYKGYGIGILDGSDSYYVSASGDLESWHPKNKFPVSRATGDFLSFAMEFGEELLIGTGHTTWRLVGDQVPFRAVSVHPSYGCVSQDAGLMVEGRFYGWDRVHGPYVTDLVQWRKLGLHRIDNTLVSINQVEIADVRAVHDERRGLIGWAVPLLGTARRRMILWYSYVIDSWLPPQTGMEYGSLASFTESGTQCVYMGDYWGRVYELCSGTKDGVPTESPVDNVRDAAVLSATANTLTLSVGAASLYVAGSGLAGMPVAVVDPTGDTWQWRIIQSNTADTITLDTVNGSPWTIIPEAGYRAIIGGIEWYQWTPWIDHGVPHLEKRLDHLWIQAKTASATHALEVRMRFNNDDRAQSATAFTFTVSQGAAIWDVSLWDVALWSEVQRQLRKKRINRSPFTSQIQFRNYEPDQEIKLTLWGLTTDVLPGRKAHSVGGR